VAAAETGAPDGATLVLDFTPNAADSGIYAARRRGLYREEVSMPVGTGESLGAEQALDEPR
jgi:hypothetical protein